MRWILAILGGMLLGVAGTLTWIAQQNSQPQSPVMVGKCPAPRSVNVASAIRLGLIWKEQEAVVGGNLDPEVVGKDLPAEFVTEEGRNFALCLFTEQHPQATQQDLLCYSLFLASAADPTKLEPFKQECFSVSRVSHVGKLENIVFSMVQSPTEDQISLRLAPNLRTFWVSQDVNAAGFGQLMQKICTLPKSSCLECIREGESTSISLKPGTTLVSAGTGYPSDAKVCGS